MAIEFTDKYGRVIVVECTLKHAPSAHKAAIEEVVLNLLQRAPITEYITRPTRD